MKIYESYPPNYNDIFNALGNVAVFKPVFAYSPDIYNPFKRELTADVIHHEQVHIQQQSVFTDPQIWYVKYLYDKDFRFKQELEAYGSQYQFGKKVVMETQRELNKDGKRIEAGATKIVDAFLDSLAGELSGDAYGNLCSFGEARNKIRRQPLLDVS